MVRGSTVLVPVLGDFPEGVLSHGPPVRGMRHQRPRPPFLPGTVSLKPQRGQLTQMTAGGSAALAQPFTENGHCGGSPVPELVEDTTAQRGCRAT